VALARWAELATLFEPAHFIVAENDSTDSTKAILAAWAAAAPAREVLTLDGLAGAIASRTVRLAAIRNRLLETIAASPGLAAVDFLVVMDMDEASLAISAARLRRCMAFGGWDALFANRLQAITTTSGRCATPGGRRTIGSSGSSGRRRAGGGGLPGCAIFTGGRVRSGLAWRRFRCVRPLAASVSTGCRWRSRGAISVFATVASSASTCRSTKRCTPLARGSSSIRGLINRMPMPLYRLIRAMASR
jgi:hypothetical protein